MRSIVIFIAVVMSMAGLAQMPSPAGIANSYQLTDKDGYPGFNYSLYKQAADGTCYAVQYNKLFTISGNNYFLSFDTLQKLTGTIGAVKALDHQEAWVFGLDYVAVFKHQQLSVIIPFGFEMHGVNEDYYPDRAVIFANTPGGLATYQFDGKSIRPLGSTGQPSLGSSNSICMGETRDTWLSKKITNGVELYRFNFERNDFEHLKTIAHPNVAYVSYVKDPDHLLIVASADFRKGYWYANGQLQPTPYALNTGNSNLIRLSGRNQLNFYQVFVAGGNQYFTATFDSNGISKQLPFSVAGGATSVQPQPNGNFHVATGSHAYRVFPLLKKYPAIYNGNSAGSIFSLKLDDDGRVWAGSYQGYLSIIAKDKVQQLPEKRFAYMNAGSYYNGCMYLVGEGVGGLVQFDKSGTGRQVIPHTYTGYCTLLSRNQQQFYFGTTAGYGLWQTTTKSLATLRPEWNKIDSLKGSKVPHILTIAEDTLGRIWYGAARQALAMYNPATDQATTWETAKKQSPFGAYSSAVDQHGTVWIGSSLNGLWYYNDYHQPAVPGSFKRVQHPFLNGNITVSALTVYKNWLVIAAIDKLLLLQIDSLYEHQKVIIRYLNPQEASFTAPTEQNTLITSKTDSTVWFSTSDMLYQWEIASWLKAPVFKVHNSVVMMSGGRELSLETQSSRVFEPGFNSFEIQCRFLSPDNLPRYTSATLVQRGDSISMPAPTTESTFSFKNVAAGNYTFLLDVFESDGSITHYRYPIELKKFIWKQWWFWPGIGLLLFTLLGYLLYNRRKREIAEQSIQLKEAELLLFKKEQEKKLANLQLVSLSSQFRPHFILNALNSIGAQMHEKPDTESVLSRLGESVNIIFNHSLQQKIGHSFANEWLLVKNVIHIHRLMYLKQLQTQFPEESLLERMNQVEVPLGLIQIPVENALLHGLSNKESGPWHLAITITENDHYFIVQITDNGVGRTAAATLSNFTKHGTGTKNIRDVLAIVNANNVNKIDVQYSDDIYEVAGKKYGTLVTIEIPKRFDYDQH